MNPELKKMAESFQVPAINLDCLEVAPDVLKLIPYEVGKQLGVYPVARVGKSFIVAMADPTDTFARDEIGFLTGLDICPVVAPKEKIEERLSDLSKLPPVPLCLESEPTTREKLALTAALWGLSYIAEELDESVSPDILICAARLFLAKSRFLLGRYTSKDTQILDDSRALESLEKILNGDQYPLMQLKNLAGKNWVD